MSSPEEQHLNKQHILHIETVRPKLFTGSQVINTEAHVTQKNEHILSAPSDGVIDKVYTFKGKHLLKGQAILHLKNPEQDIQISHLSRSLKLEAEQLKNLNLKLKNNLEMYKLGLIARNQLNTIKNEIKSKKLGINSLKSEQKILFNRQSHLLLYNAPPKSDNENVILSS